MKGLDGVVFLHVPIAFNRAIEQLWYMLLLYLNCCFPINDIKNTVNECVCVISFLSYVLHVNGYMHIK